MQRPRRILLAQTSFVGDVVLTTALARTIEQAWPEVELHWLVRPDAAPLVEPFVGAERVIVFDKRGADRGIGGMLATSRKLRARRFDAALGVQRSLRTAVLLAAAGIPLRVGYADSPGRLLYHRRVARTGAHARDRLVELARGLEIASPEPPLEPRLRVAPEADARIVELLRLAAVAPSERLLVLAPGSAWATKRWPAARFGEAARELVPRYADRVVVIGAPGDSAHVAAIRASLGGDAASALIDLTGKTNLAEAVAVIARAALVIANDSGPAHIAAALGRPLITLFGPTVPAQGFAPLGASVRIVERDLACRPCSRHGSDRCPIGTHECLADLPGTAVARAAADLLDGARSATAPGAT